MIQTLISIAALLVFGLQLPSEPVEILSENTSPVTGLAWSPDGTQLAVSRGDGQVEIWRFEQDAMPTAPDVTFTAEHVEMLQWTSHSLELITHESRIDNASGYAPYPALKQVQRWDSRTGELLDRPFHYSGYTHYPFPLPEIAWNSDFTRFAYSNSNRDILLEGQIFASVEHFPVEQLLWSPDDRMLAVVISNSSDFYRILTYDVASGELIMLVQGPDYYVEQMAWSPDGQWVAVVSPWINVSGIDYSVTVYLNRSDQEYLAGYIYPEDEIKYFSNEEFFTREMDRFFPPQVAWSPDGLILAVSSSTTVDLYDFASEEKIASPPVAYTTALSWHPDGHWLAAGSDDGMIRLWAVDSLVGD